MTNGSWMLMQDHSIYGTRNQIPVDFTTYPGGLPVNESFVVAFDPTEWTGQFTLVFKANGAPTDLFTIEVIAKSFRPVVGACCTGDSCAVREEQECIALGGTFMGADSTCETTCPGACCTTDGGCQITNLTQCQTISGSFLGFGTTCDQCCSQFVVCPSDCEDCPQSYTLDVSGLHATFNGPCFDPPSGVATCDCDLLVDGAPPFTKLQGECAWWFGDQGSPFGYWMPGACAALDTCFPTSEAEWRSSLSCANVSTTISPTGSIWAINVSIIVGCGDTPGYGSYVYTRLPCVTDMGCPPLGEYTYNPTLTELWYGNSNNLGVDSFGIVELTD